MPLSPKRKNLAQVIVANPGLSKAEQAIMAGYSEKGAHVRASEAYKDQAFLDYLAELEAPVIEKIQEAGFNALTRLDKVAEYCEGMVEVTISDKKITDENGEEVQRKITTEQMRDPKTAVRALELLGRSQGDFNADETDRPEVPAIMIIRATDIEYGPPKPRTVSPPQSKEIPPLPDH